MGPGTLMIVKPPSCVASAGHEQGRPMASARGPLLPPGPAVTSASPTATLQKA
jgi:hypothetical protein